MALQVLAASRPGIRLRGATIRLEGGLLGPDILEQLETGDLPGQRPADFGLPARTRLDDEFAATYHEARALWQTFQHRLERRPAGQSETTLTRDLWVRPLLSLLGYDLVYNQKGYQVDGLVFAISHRAGQQEDAPPVHAVAYSHDLGRVSPTGRPRLSPHALVQEFLNRTEHLWGITTNGRILRLLRKSTYVRRQAYIEFDLEALFEQDRFEDFRLLYRMLHRSRLPQGVDDGPECLLEQYFRLAEEQGSRVRDRLRDGVEACIQCLANGLLSHPENTDLRQRARAVASGESQEPLAAELHRNLLRLVYRLLFLLVAEERGLLGGNDLYRAHYSVSRLRRLADNRRAYSDHGDLWQSLIVLWDVLRDDRSLPQLENRTKASVLDLPVLDGDLFQPLRGVDDQRLSNRDLLRAFWYLAYYYDDEARTLRPVNYAALDVEELGSVYESLLELEPRLWLKDGRPKFDFHQGGERKSTGSYYTPRDLVAELVRSALEPVIEERLKWAERVASGEWRTGDGEWDEEAIGHVHTVLSRSGYLEPGDGSGGGGVPPDTAVPQAGAVRDDLPDASGGGVHPGQHRRGVEPGDEGIPSVPEDRAGKSAGTGDPSAAGPEGRPLLGGSGSAPARERAGSGQANPDASAQSAAEIEQLRQRWLQLPAATRHSLFAQHALLSIKVLDPATGSGHFLLAAARRLGHELARVRTGEEEPAPEAVREAVRDVITHCIYGVDKNPMAVELCKVALWIEGHTPGRPLTFLDHRIRCGDSLVGVFDLKVLEEGIPDGAFKALSDDDKKLVNSLKKQNREERRGQRSLFLTYDAAEAMADLRAAALALDRIPDDSPLAVREKQAQYLALREKAEPQILACHLWTAAFFQRRDPETPREAFITTDTLRRYLEGQPVAPQALAAAQALAERHRFFHWPLEFPEVFAQGGFDVVLSNPPWERVKLQEREFFATKDPEIANAPNAAARRRLIRRLPETNPALWEAYREALHAAEATSQFLRESGRYPLTGRGDINTYSVFAELVTKANTRKGRVGIIVPTGIATQDTNKHFFAHIFSTGRLVSLLDFENRPWFFQDVATAGVNFCLLTLRGDSAAQDRADFVFYATHIEHLRDPTRRFPLSEKDISLVNPNTRTLPVFRTRQDAELTRAIYERVPVLVNEGTGENPWGVRFQAMFHMSNDSHLFRTRPQLEAEGYRLVGNRFVRGREVYLPLYEAKMIWHYDHRFGTYDGVESRRSTQLPNPGEAQHANPAFLAQPWYWVSAGEVEARLDQWERGWLLGFRDVTRPGEKRTAIFSLLPRVGVGNKIPLWLFDGALSVLQASLLANTSSLPFDYVARQKVGGTTMNFFYVKQFPVLPPDVYNPVDLLFIVPRVLELTYTAWDIKPFADDVWREADEGLRAALRSQWEANAAETGGHDWTLPGWIEAYPEIETDPEKGIPLPPFKWDEERRARLRAELDAYYARLYGLTRKQLRYILDPADLTEKELEDILDPWEEVDDPLDPEGYAARVAASDFPGETFRVLKEKELREYGEYRTRRLVLEAWERLAAEAESQTRQRGP